jgi:hypothetical protein
VVPRRSGCLLPKTDNHLRRLKVIENEIESIPGEAILLETVGLDRAQGEKVVRRFTADRDEAYREFIDKCADFEAEIAKKTAAEHFTYAELEESDEDIEKLKGWLAKIQRLDFYQAPLGQEAEARLRHCVDLLETYARQVFDAQEENRTRPDAPEAKS